MVLVNLLDAASPPRRRSGRLDGRAGRDGAEVLGFLQLHTSYLTLYRALVAVVLCCQLSS